jgi:hypothetical protein
MRRLCCLAALILICCVTSACAFGPQVATRFVIVQPGRPLLILSNDTVTGKRLDDDSYGEQAIGGWVAMPREHFDALTRAIESKGKP